MLFPVFFWEGVSYMVFLQNELRNVFVIICITSLEMFSQSFFFFFLKFSIDIILMLHICSCDQYISYVALRKTWWSNIRHVQTITTKKWFFFPFLPLLLPSLSLAPLEKHNMEGLWIFLRFLFLKTFFCIIFILFFKPNKYWDVLLACWINIIRCWFANFLLQFFRWT